MMAEQTSTSTASSTDTSSSGRDARRRRWAYGGLVTMTFAVAIGSLAIAAPAWLPGHPRMSLIHDHHELAGQTRALRERQQTLLSEYRWIDREAGVVGMPIDRAMALWLAEQQAERGDRSERQESKP